MTMYPAMTMFPAVALKNMSDLNIENETVSNIISLPKYEMVDYSLISSDELLIFENYINKLKDSPYNYIKFSKAFACGVDIDSMKESNIYLHNILQDMHTEAHELDETFEKEYEEFPGSYYEFMKIKDPISYQSHRQFVNRENAAKQEIQSTLLEDYVDDPVILKKIIDNFDVKFMENDNMVFIRKTSSKEKSDDLKVVYNEIQEYFKNNTQSTIVQSINIDLDDLADLDDLDQLKNLLDDTPTSD